MTIITSSAPAPQDASEFRRRRERLQLGVRELAAAMGVSPGLVSMMQNGKRPIRRVYWLALAPVELRAAVEDTGEKAAEGKEKAAEGKYEAW